MGLSRQQSALRSRIDVETVGSAGDDVEIFDVKIRGLWVERLKLAARTAQTTKEQFVEEALTGELVYRMMNFENARVKVTPAELRELADRLEAAAEKAKRKLAPRELRIARGDDFRDICKR